MSKGSGHLWPHLTSFQNLLLAYRKAARGKRSKPSVAGFEYDLEANLLGLQAELRGGSYRPGAYSNFFIHDPKRRLISAAPFRDRVVHHALVNILEPIFEPKFIHDSYANRQGKGTHRALDRCTQFLRRYQYVLPMDVVQFFPSVDHAILLDILARTIDDQRVLRLAEIILAGGAGVQANEYSMVCFPGDDLLATNRPRGLPIGNLTSQFWANVYLNGLDHHIKRDLKCRGYLRYVDDLRLFDDEKAALHAWRDAVVDYTAGLRLTIHENSAQPRPSASGVPFLGFQVFRDHRRLKRRNALHARRRFRSLMRSYAHGEADLDQVGACVKGWINHARYGDTWGLRRAIFADCPLCRGAGGRVLRGGSWNNNAQNVRAAVRNRNTPDNRNDNIGFRPARPSSSWPECGALACTASLRCAARAWRTSASRPCLALRSPNDSKARQIQNSLAPWVPSGTLGARRSDRSLSGVKRPCPTAPATASNKASTAPNAARR